jgi:hypothetical protein
MLRSHSHCVEHGLPHWDVRGKECLEVALKDVADAQIYCGEALGRSAGVDLQAAWTTVVGA